MTAGTEAAAPVPATLPDLRARRPGLDRQLDLLEEVPCGRLSTPTGLGGVRSGDVIQRHTGRQLVANEPLDPRPRIAARWPASDLTAPLLPGTVRPLSSAPTVIVVSGPQRHHTRR